MIKLLLFVLLIPSFSFGQNLTSTETSGGSNIYNDAIRRYIAYSTKGGKPMYDTLFFQHDSIITDSILSFKHKSIKVSLQLDDIKKKLETETDFILHRLYPLQVDNGKFAVGIVPFIVRKEADELIFSNPGSYRAEYLYNSIKKRFEFRKHSFQGF